MVKLSRGIATFFTLFFLLVSMIFIVICGQKHNIVGLIVSYVSMLIFFGMSVILIVDYFQRNQETKFKPKQYTKSK